MKNRKKSDGRRKEKKNPSQNYVEFICSLYGDSYDDREEDSSPGGLNWQPGQKAMHTSLEAFRRKLLEVHGIELSTAKIRKILITGKRWSTERSREVLELFERYGSVSRVSEELGLPVGLVTTYLPYQKTVYVLEDKSGNAKRIDRWKKRNRA